jgi:hypothetical protein
MRFFKTKTIPRKSFFKKIFRLPERRYFILALENLFAEMGLKDALWAEVDALYEAYHIRPGRDQVEERIAMLRSFLVHCFENHELTDDEVIRINLLKKYLKLSDSQIQRAKDEASRKVYKMAFQEAAKDHQLDGKEREQLEKLEGLLNLDEAVKKEVQSESAHALIKKLFQEIVADERVSDEEAEKLRKLTDNLKIDINWEQETKAMYDRFRLYWKLENSPLEPVQAGINLFKTERCYFTSPCEWYELKSVTRRYNYAGPTFRLKLAKGLYYRMGSIAVKPIREEELQKIDTGMLFLTDRRVIFMGGRQNRTHRLSSILDFDTFSNGIELQRSSGKNPFLVIQNADIASLTLGRILEEY